MTSEKLSFTKLHGLGNDFILFVDDNKTDYFALADKLCSRKLGIGADGLLIVCSSDIADIKMRIINSDGSEAQMCGNGIRCFSKYVYEHGIVNKSSFTIETLAGIMTPTLKINNGMVESVRVNMGKPSFEAKSLPMLFDGQFLQNKIKACNVTLTATAVLMGVPHLIVFDAPNDMKLLEQIGDALEHHELFPERTNADFVKVIDRQNISILTWERGCGFTLACGTGSCASVVACIKAGLVDNKVCVHHKVGSLMIELADNGTVFMTGEAKEVFSGSFDKRVFID